MGTDAVLSGASQRADAHHRRFSRSPRLASLILSPSLAPLQLSLKPTTSSLSSSPSRSNTEPSRARRRPSASPCRSLGIRVYPLFRLSNAQSSSLALVREAFSVSSVFSKFFPVPSHCCFSLFVPLSLFL